jgi:hypothetical protein
MPQVLCRWISLVLFFAASGCDGVPDPRSVEGALGYAMRAVERDDAGDLYKVIDERARHAMISIVNDRREAATLIEASYPAAERASALAALGDAAEAENAAALFAHRCDRPCREAIGATLGAPAEVRREGELTVVATARGTTVRLYRGGDGHGWYGIVWHTAELSTERDRANRDLGIIRENAATYDRRQALEASGAAAEPR